MNESKMEDSFARIHASFVMLKYHAGMETMLTEGGHELLLPYDQLHPDAQAEARARINRLFANLKEFHERRHPGMPPELSKCDHNPTQGQINPTCNSAVQ